MSADVLQVVGAVDDQAGADKDPEAGEEDPRAHADNLSLPASEQTQHTWEKTGMFNVYNMYNSEWFK